MFQHYLKDDAVKTCGKRTTYLVPLDKLRGLGASKWSMQRPADDARVLEIRTGIETAGDVTGVLCMAWHPIEKMIVYDGQHRWQALLSIQNSDIRVFVEVLWDATEEEIVAAFKTVNACVPVSELYLCPEAKDVRPEIKDLVTRINTQFPAFASPAKNPHRPHFNIHNLEQELYEIWSTTFDRKRTIADIGRGLVALNRRYQDDLTSCPRAVAKNHSKIIEKCEKYKFWLFAESGHINRDHLRAVLNPTAQ